MGRAASVRLAKQRGSIFTGCARTGAGAWEGAVPGVPPGKGDVPVMADALFEEALDVLKREHVERFVPSIRKEARTFPGGFKEEIFLWPDGRDDDVIVDVHQSSGVQEAFHHHDYFYFNYAYRGSYGSVVDRAGSTIEVCEGELFAGQPFTGHAICAHDDASVDMIAVLIRKDAFFRTYLPLVLGSERMFAFCVHAERDETSDEYIHLSFSEDSNILRTLKMLVIEYARRRKDSASMLRALVHLFLVQVARRLEDCGGDASEPDVAGRIMRHITENLPTVTLESTARCFAYHPNYVSELLRKRFGKTFSALVLEQKMDRAARMLQSTTLSVEEVAVSLGYSTKSSFYKAYKKCFGTTPRGGLHAG